MAQDKDIDIRIATLDDLPRMFEVEQSAFPQDRWASESVLRQRLAMYPQGTWVGIYGSEVAVYTNGFPIRNLSTQAELDPPDEQLFQADGSIWLLRNLAVHQDFQRKGLGKLLVDRQLQLAHEHGAKWFRFTATENLHDYYAGLGFTMIRPLEVFHGLPQSVWEMRI